MSGGFKDSEGACEICFGALRAAEMRQGVEEMDNSGLSELGLLTSWLPEALSGVNTLRGVELDSRHLFLDQFHGIVVLFLWILASVAKVFLLILPSPLPLPLLTTLLQKLSTQGGESFGRRPWVKLDGGRRVEKLSSSAIGRALTQVLVLLNEVPASSNKYAFLQSIADKVIEENKVQGVGYKYVNQAALRTGFARTIDLLGQSLEGRQYRETWLWRLLRMLPVGSVFPNLTILAPFVKVRSLVGKVFDLFNPWTSNLDFSGTLYAPDPEMAEKLAKQLLWIAEKLLDCGGAEAAIQQWSSAPSLAELSLCATPRVQKSLVRLSALLCRGLVDDTKVPQEAHIKLVLLWLPLLCNATHGGDGPIFSSIEKVNAQRVLERAILCLPESDQELILSTWLQEYAMSQSDWPNLQNCYHDWCHATRKLEHRVTEVNI